MSSWSSCNFTQQIFPNECIGDSLATINQNFSALDVGLCGASHLVPGPSTDVHLNFTEQKKTNVSVAVRNSYEYITDFESMRVSSPLNIELGDGTIINAVKFPYIESITDYKPQVSFTSVALSNKPPTVTLCWMASGIDYTTVYALNSAFSTQERGPLYPNKSINVLKVYGNKLYVGGDFTTINDQQIHKFCEFELGTGSFSPTKGYVGSVAVDIPFHENLDLGLGPNGSVDAIEVTDDFLVVGGSFSGGSKGRGLCILNKQTNEIYPFYVNGNVNAVKIVDDVLYVGGQFDYVNYGPESASELSNLREYSSGLVTIYLGILTINPFGSIQGHGYLFTGPASVNAIESYGTNGQFEDKKIFFGGSFVIKDGERVLAQNLCLIDKNTDPIRISENWKPIINGPVSTILIDDTTLDGGLVYIYVGGSFNRVYTEQEFNNNPRTTGFEQEYYNAVSFSWDEQTEQVAVQKFWKPKFNRPINKFAIQNNQTDGNVYCYGQFTMLNGEHQNYLGCIKKSSAGNTTNVGETVFWKPFLESAPLPQCKGLSLYNNGTRDSIIVGGSFSKVNRNIRYSLAEISIPPEVQNMSALSSVHWDLDCKVVSPGMDYTFDYTNMTRVSSVPGPFETINYTSLPVDPKIFNGVSEGQVVRFLIRRAGNSRQFGNLSPIKDTLSRPVSIIGVKIDYN